MSIDATRWAWQQRDITPAQKLVLLSMADRAGEEHRCWPSNARLCADTGLDRKTVYACIEKLEAMNLLRTVRQKGMQNIYELLGVRGREDAQAGRAPCVSVTSPEMGTSPQNTTSPKNTTSPENGTEPVPKTDFDQSQKRDTNLKENLSRTGKSARVDASASSAVLGESPEAAAPEAFASAVPCVPPSPPASSAPSAPPGPTDLSGPSGLSVPPGPTGPTAPPRQPQGSPPRRSTVKPVSPKPSPPKLPHGENGHVLLTEAEHARLCARYGREWTTEAVTLLDLHIDAGGKDKYVSHCAALQKWVFDAVNERRLKLRERPFERPTPPEQRAANQPQPYDHEPTPEERERNREAARKARQQYFNRREQYA